MSRFSVNRGGQSHLFLIRVSRKIIGLTNSNSMVNWWKASHFFNSESMRVISHLVVQCLCVSFVQFIVGCPVVVN